MSSGMNKELDSDWLEHLETLDEIKEESVEINEEPFNGIADIKQEDIIYYSSGDVEDATVEINEELDYFANFKQEVPILDALNSIGNESVEIKEEPIDNFVDMKEEELSSLPITDIFCPSSGDSRPLTVDFDNGMHSRSQIAPPRPTIMKATKTITVTGPVRVTRDAVIKLDRNLLNISIFPLDAVATSKDLISPMNGASVISDCTVCKYLDPNSDAMEQHVRLRHSERVKRKLQDKEKCAFCDDFYMNGDEMHSHTRSMHPEELVKSKKRKWVESGIQTKVESVS